MKKYLTNFKVAENSKRYIMLGIIIVLICTGGMIIRGFNFGIDFLGGTIIHLDLHKEFDTDDVQSIIKDFELNADITYSGDNKEEVIISTREDLDQNIRNKIIAVFEKEYGINAEKDVLSIDNVDGSIGKELQQQMCIASIIAVICILVYIWFRFEFRFGVAAICALVYDILVVMGMYAILQIQVNSSFIAALLTILGYSINDTIVIFDRVRENKRKYANLAELVDTSINGTFIRTLNTTLTTLIAIIPLFLLGGASIEEFVLPLMIGFMAGMYSSLFIAPSVWYKLELQSRGKNKK